MRKRRRGMLVAVVAFVLGAGLILYPYVSDWYHKSQQSEVVAVQATVVEETDDSDLEDARAAALDYNARLLNSRSVVTDPFDATSQRVTTEEYTSLMNLAGDGVMGTLVIPSIDLTMPIYHGTDEETLQEGVGHLEETSLPYGGASSHCVLAGHNGLPSVKIFDRIGELEEGDYFIIQVLGEDHAYRVTGVETVLPEETESLVIEEGRDLVTLVTCTPYGINTHRLLVHAERCDVPQEWLDREAGTAETSAPTVADVAEETPLVQFTLIGLAVAAGLLLAWWLAAKRKKNRERVAMAAGSRAAVVRPVLGVGDARGAAGGGVGVGRGVERAAPGGTAHAGPGGGSHAAAHSQPGGPKHMRTPGSQVAASRVPAPTPAARTRGFVSEVDRVRTKGRHFRE